MDLYNRFKILMLSIISIAVANGCGVKGKPLPPEEPAFIGRGQDASTAVPAAEVVPLVSPTAPPPKENVRDQKTLPTPKKKPAKSKIKQ
jgi:hypothetical protein